MRMTAGTACKLVGMLADMLASSLDSMLGGRAAGPVAVAIGVIAVPVMLGGTAPAIAADAITKRSVLGSVMSSHSLEISTEPGAWTPAVQGAAVLEDSELRTGPGRPALIGFGKDGVISLHEGSRLRVGRMGADGVPVTLQGDGAMNFRLPADSRLQLLTDAAVLSAGRVDGPDTSVQGIVSQNGGVTMLSVVRGTMHARQHDSDETTDIARGEQATFRRPDGDTAEVTQVTGESDYRTRRLTSLRFLGQRPGLVIAGATIAAVGGGLGIAAAAGAFDSSSGSNQSSPFEP